MAEHIKWKPVPKEMEEITQKMFGTNPNYHNRIVSEPYGVYATPAMESVAKEVYNMQVRSDDIWIVGFPKCGTTLTQEMVWQIANNVDIEAANNIPLHHRSPFLEVDGVMGKKPPTTLYHVGTTIVWSTIQILTTEKSEYSGKSKESKEKINGWIKAENAPSPRVIKTHLPFEFLPPKLLDTCKVIFVGRNPKDVCVSFYHMHNISPDQELEGNFNGFADLFLQGANMFGSYWNMLKSAWKRKDHPNLKILWFEDMTQNMIKSIQEVASFTGYHLTELKMLQLDDLLYIDNFRKAVVNSNEGDEVRQKIMKKFIRKGQVGDWKNYFTDDMNKIWNKWITKHLEDTNIMLPSSTK